MNGGEAVAHVLARAGVGHVFGLLGGSMLELYDALYGSEATRYVGARDERAAAHMADAYARITGGPGVVLGAQAGPGAANLVTGLAEAHLAYSPLVAIAGLVPRDHLGRDTFQEIDQQALFAPVTKRSFMVPSAERLPEMLHEALRLAMSGRRGPVVLNVPRDLFAAPCTPDEHHGRLAAPGAGAPEARQLAAILDLLAAARAPVIVAGGGIKWSRGSAALATLAEALEIPVAASVGHGDVLPGDHPLFAGQMGPRGNRVANRLTRDADLLIALGTRLGFNSTFHSHDYVWSRAPSAAISRSRSGSWPMPGRAPRRCWPGPGPVASRETAGAPGPRTSKGSGQRCLPSGRARRSETTAHSRHCGSSASSGRTCRPRPSSPSTPVPCVCRRPTGCATTGRPGW
jgi:acetolactate synthase-1/2/3 large subunit/sulfoacetaldehyde acetyltransferase